jgi:hypothetical protein
MVQFWAQKEVNFVHYRVLYFAYCAMIMTEYFDAMEVCCEAVVTCVELEMCHCLFSGFVFVVFPCRFDVLPLFCWMMQWLLGRTFLEFFVL